MTAFKQPKTIKDVIKLPRVDVRQDEPLDKALRRLKKKIEREGILKVLKSRKHYEKPSEVKRRKKRSSQKRRYSK